ncbi:MAG TPA: M23 family metallopeptidase [Patescibacteria group bacterium]|nr:M23 family metallopeptidase [Patescibacteria group bacterium]
MSLFRPAFLALALLCAHSPQAQEGTDTQQVRIDVPSLNTAIGGEFLLPADPAEDRRRSIRLSRTPVFATPVARVKGTGLMLRNRLHAPVTIDLELDGLSNAKLAAAMMPRVTLAPLESREVILVQGVDLMRTGSADFSLKSTVGSPDAKPDQRHVYAWPLAETRRSRISQGFNGPTHDEEFSQFAIDIAVKEGTPVVAARAGVVVFLEDRFFESGLDRTSFRDKANHVRILHDDGSMATYAHLAPDSVRLVPGQRVAVGDEIGRSGNTGFSSGPHLHFAILVNRDMKIVSVPFRMDGVKLPLAKD